MTDLPEKKNGQMDIKYCEVERLGPHYTELDMAKKKKRKCNERLGMKLK